MGDSLQSNATFAALFRRLYPRLCRFLATLLGDSRLAEELAQESLLRLYRSPMRQASEDDARNWVFRVGRNLALNECKHAAMVKRLTPLHATSGVATASTPEQELHRKQELTLVFRLVRELPETQRSALLLREQEQMTYDQIARVLNITLANVKVSISRARRTIRDGWRREFVNPGKSRRAIRRRNEVSS